MNSLILLLVGISYAKIDYAIYQLSGCGDWGTTRLYKRDMCKKTSSGSVMFKTSANGNNCDKYVYQNSDCSGTVSGAVDTSSGRTLNPPSLNIVGFFGDQNGDGCKDNDKIDGVYATDRCYKDNAYWRFTIVEVDGKNELHRRCFTSTTCAEDQYYDGATEKSECNKCTNGNLVKCYGVDGVAAWTDFSEKIPEESKGSEEHSESHNQQNSASLITLCISMMIIALMI
ncbi:hypothetical protein EIN_324230 [Entamoeba invadens IP1]|uniref:Uncharacterized protein n=1 Tax=Entamoeba invadens IP1 TaxID=370355 RepID=L7FNX5_ENTIV|nr:hypothetical protein EIN_324230 [Entamoeba invadens IP1]ELP92505.1 hypothetical protein EIN_324230 [Entamoeba invadens IP1]|eukprot:XP_004259276.1 hypothetical protein EIN_324230 [Entamoeba invadens IP1]